MIVAIDVDYAGSAPTVAAVGFAGWSDQAPALEHVLESRQAPAPYEPGAFFRRELPYLLEVLVHVQAHVAVDVVVVDGHAWLREGELGLGARLHEALQGRCPVVGVAKSAFEGGVGLPVLRGGSRQPLYVSAAGMDADRAAALVGEMHGPHRLPALLARTDQLARRLARPDPARVLPLTPSSAP